MHSEAMLYFPVTEESELVNKNSFKKPVAELIGNHLLATANVDWLEIFGNHRLAF